MDASEIRKAWEDKGKKVLYGGLFTKGFIKFNNRLLKSGETNELVYDKNKLFNRTTGRVVFKNKFYKQDGSLRDRFNNDRFVVDGDAFIQPVKYIELNYKKKINDYIKSKEENILEIDLEEINYDVKHLLQFIRPRLNQNIYINIGDSWFALNMNSIKNIQNALVNQETEGPYGELINIIQVSPSLNLVFREMKKKAINGGAFFPFFHNLDQVVLDKYGIFNTMNTKNYETNCLCECFKAKGIDYTAVKCMVKNQEIPMKKLKDVATNLNLWISVRNIDDKSNLRHYGDKSNPRLELGLIRKHYFLIEKTEYTSYSIRNYFKIKDEKNFNMICGDRGKGYIRRKDKFITSYDCIKILLANEKTHLREITLNNDIYGTLHYNKVNDNIFTDLSYNTNIYNPHDFKNPVLEGNLQKNKYKKYKPDPSLKATLFFDFETSTSSEKEYDNKKENTNPYHTPYCVYTDKHRNGFFGAECGKYLLDALIAQYGEVEQEGIEPPKIRLIAHNAGYDFRFLVKYVHRLQSIEKGNGLMVANCTYYKNDLILNIEVKDSMKMINMPLKKFGKSFGLDVKKEIMPYDLYSEENVNKTFIDKDICLSYVDEEDHAEYLENCERWGCLSENNQDSEIDILKYAGEYCYMDCIVLRDGYRKFGELVQEAIDEDIENYISLASMADNYLKKQGCYDGCLMLSGTPRHFIQKCVVGGRTMVSENKKSRNLKSETYEKYGIKEFNKYSHKNKIISDFDAVSLYPSAMARMTGFLKGAPKIINDFDSIRNIADGYFICCRIKSVKKKYKFPCTSIINEQGIRCFTNDLIGNVVYFDKVGLEDFENFHQGEIEFINGYWYNKGVNNKINETMEYLFAQRLKYKSIIYVKEGDDTIAEYANEKDFKQSIHKDYQFDKGNPIQMVFKELMNSSYGKASLKAIESDNVYKKPEEFMDFMDRHYNYIKEACKMPNGYYKIKLAKTIDTHFNNVPQGASILSWSKRIMYEVMTLAEDNNYPMYITDTDSLHIDSDKVEPLGEKFKEKYGRELIGEQMGQFHTDFEMSKEKKPKTDIFAIESIFLGKKAYIDKLQAFDKDGKELIDYHIRLKGIPNDCIIHKANEKEYGGDLMKLYNDLYEGKTITFNLLAVRPKFEVLKNMHIITKQKFNRRVKF